jgi:hypothetical protein
VPQLEHAFGQLQIADSPAKPARAMDANGRRWRIGRTMSLNP